MTLQLITPLQWQTQRWQNGGGITHQLARSDDAEGLLWRLSVADVASDGPFSRFDGIERVILLLDGAGFCLHGVGDNPQNIHRPLQPFRFAGESAIHCTLLDGAVRDFNLMTRRDAVQAELQVLSLNSTIYVLPPSPQTLIFVASGSVDVAFGATQLTLDTQHTLSLGNENASVQLSSAAGAQIISISLWIN
jgi:uncharacterized protein